MARTIDQIQADIDSVLADAARSETQVRLPDGSEVANRSEDDRRKALESLRYEMGQAQAATPGTRTRTFLLYGNKGF